MVQNIGEIVTIVAIALISLIFALYLIILRKNGWLGGKSDFYRCPNQECKKIFEKPIELKDLSMNPPRTYPACPECGANLNPFFSSITDKIPKIRPKPLSNQKKIEIKQIEKKTETKRISSNQHQNQTSILRQKTPPTKSEIKTTLVQRVEPTAQKQLSMPREKVPIIMPGIKLIEKKNEMKTAEAPTHPQKLPSTPIEEIPIGKKTIETGKTNSTDNSGCEYFFGYLATINIKEYGTPLICLECPKTLECLLYNYMK